MTKCPRCGELLSGDRELCPSCGRVVPDPDRSVERRLRIVVIGAFVIGALALVGGMVRDSLLRH